MSTVHTKLPPSITAASKSGRRLVLLVSAVVDPVDFIFYNNISPGLIYVEAGIKRLSHEVETKIIYWHDLPAAPGGKEKAFREILEKLKPAVVGISAYSIFMPLAVSIAATVRSVDPEIPIILGGAHPTAFPDGIGRYPMFDFYVRGEGARVAPGLINHLFDQKPALGDINSLSFRIEGTVATTPLENPPETMDDDPKVDWKAVDYGDFSSNKTTTLGDRDFLLHFRGGKLFPYETSRGCRHQCNFCERIGKRALRYRSPEKVVKDLAAIKRWGGVRYFFFSDDLIHSDRDRFKSLLHILKTELDSKYYAAVRADEIDRDLIDRMIDSGIHIIHCFPESASPRIKKSMGKPIDTDLLLSNMSYASKQGALVLATFIFGWPGETTMEAERTIELAKSEAFDLVSFTPVFYFGAAPIGKYLEKAGIRPDTRNYFRILQNPFDICLAAYSGEEYQWYVNQEHSLNIEKIRKSSVLKKLSGYQIEVKALKRHGGARRMELS